MYPLNKQSCLKKNFINNDLQGSGSLIVYDDPTIDEAYQSAIETFQTLGNVVDTLMQRSQKVVA